MTPHFRTFVIELFSGLGPIEIRRVFNFDGLYRGETMFGLVADEQIYLKTDASSRSAFECEDSAPLKYKSRDGADVAMSYYELPKHLYDEPEEAAAWARTAYEIAARSPNAMRKARRRPKQEPPHQSGRGRQRT